MGLIVCMPTVVVAQPLKGKKGENLDRRACFRMPENDGANCLYLQLRLLGYTEHYERFSEELPAAKESVNLATLTQVGRKLGFRMAPVKMNVTELVDAGAPVIVYFEKGGIGRGQFHLFLGIDQTDTQVALINGAYVKREWMSRDQFRRGWTGYGLIARPGIDWELWTRRGATALVVFGAGVWLALRAGNWSRSAMLRTRRRPLNGKEMDLRATSNCI